jgi:hypothetical protein
MANLTPQQKRKNKITGVILALVAVGFLVTVWGNKLFLK